MALALTIDAFGAGCGLAVTRSSSSRSSSPRPSTETPDATLVDRARQGVVSAQATLFRRYARMMNDTAFRLLPWGDEADDVVQSSFIMAMDRLHQLQEPAAFGGWLRTIVVRTAHKRLRRRRLTQRLGLSSDRPVDLDSLFAPSTPPDVQAELRGVYRHIEALPAEARTALVLRKVEGQSIPEIARTMGKSEGTVKRRIRQAEELIAKALRRTEVA